MNTIKLKAGITYLICGLPGAGKTTWIKSVEGIKEEMVISADFFREKMIGRKKVVEDGVLKEELVAWSSSASEVAMEMVILNLKVRVKEKVTSFVDLTLVDNIAREKFIKIVQDLGGEVEVLIFNPDPEKAKLRNKNRQLSVTDSVIDKKAGEFEVPERNYQWIDEDSKYILEPRNNLDWNHGKWDIFGDIHGLADEFMSCLKELGYTEESGSIIHKEGRRLILLGDYVDRGQKSIETLQILEKILKNKEHVVLAGNHEEKVVRAIKAYNKDGTIPEIKGLAPKETVEALLRLDSDERNRLIKVIDNLAVQANLEAPSFGRIVLGHGNQIGIEWLENAKSIMIYGYTRNKEDADFWFSTSQKERQEKIIYIHGHVPEKSENEWAYSLEEKQAFNGFLRFVRLDEWHEEFLKLNNRRAAFKKVLRRKKVDFDFAVHRERKTKLIKTLEEGKNLDLVDCHQSSQGLVVWNITNKKGKKMELNNELQKLVENRLVTVKENEDETLKLWKYSKKVFWDHLWSESHWLLKARGLVTSIDGKIIQHPFDKIFNFGEEAAGTHLKESETVEVVEKLNGFLGNITLHPYKEGLLITSSGSFDSTFVKMIDSLISEELREKLMTRLKNKDQTLMFEIIHPDDPHIVKYDAEDCGLWLIGARGKELSDSLVSEEELDTIAKEIGCKRPKVTLMTVKEVKEKIKSVKNHEGFMLRDRVTGETICKWKTLWYLTTKFLGRMNEGNVKFLFENPKVFKTKIDEEFEEIVDRIVASTTLNDFLSKTQQERISFVGELIENLMKIKEESEKEKTFKVKV